MFDFINIYKHEICFYNDSFLMFIFFVLFVRKYLSNIFKVKNILFFISLAILFFLTLLSDDAFLERWRFFKLFSSDINTNQIGLISTFAVRYFEVVDTISHIKNTFNPLTVFLEMVQVLLLKLIYFGLGLIMNGIILTLFHLNLISISYTLVQ